jgi:2-polyprenyl-6-methoxyphenol hydroxylase-like FAD-dependent oxidoreductase
LGLLEEFLRLPHQRVGSVGVVVGDSMFEVADFRHVPTHCKFVALMPQWDFLNFLAGHAKRYSPFQLLMGHEATDLITDGRRIAGVAARNSAQEVTIHADLVVGCDGRHSVVRRAAGLEVIEHGAPIDVLWFRISRQAGDPAQVLGNVNYGKVLILIDRAEYFQAGLIVPKGSYDSIQARGIDAFRAGILQVAPWLGDRVNELRGWEQIKILTVQINRLRRWRRPGLLCIGDAAHAMSPAGGVGINLAIQDAVAAANLLTQSLKRGRVPEAALAAVERRRVFPTRVTQAIQLAAHRGMARAFTVPGPIRAPWQMEAALEIPGIHRALGYAVGVGVRPEHVRQSTRKLNRQRACLAGLAAAGFGAAVTAAFCGWAAWKLWSKITEAASQNRSREPRRHPGERVPA